MRSVDSVPSGTKQDTLAPADWVWVDRSIWTERMLAALGNGVEGRKWFSLIDKVHRPSTLEWSWRAVEANAGAAGVDGQSVKRFGAHASCYLGELSEALADGSYRAQPIRRVAIPKGGGKTRAIGIPTVKDRVAQGALKRVIEPIFEQVFEPTSYGFRPGRGCKDALREVDGLLKAGHTHVVDADLQAYFDTIPREALMARVAEHISDGRVLALLRQWLEQDVLSGLSRWTPTSGTPQGAIISPLLANLYLHGLDVTLRESGYRMVRYADDFVVLCPSAEDAERALGLVRAWVAANGLSLHPDKTHVGDCRQRGQGFDFLGYRFEAGQRWVRKSSRKAFYDKIRAKTRRSRGDSLASVIADLNPLLRGWFGYFQHAHRWTFTHADRLIRRRLRALLRKQQKRPGRGRCYADHRRWPNRTFTDAGLFTLTEAWHRTRQPR